MFPAARVEQLRKQKQALLVESEAQRRQIESVCLEIHERLGWIDGAVIAARRLLPLCGLAIPIWSLWKTRSERVSPSWLSRITGAIPLMKSLARFWRA
jgi:hypothetical protein